MSSWLIKCVAGGEICHSPVVIPRWGRVKHFVETFLWSALAPSTLNTHVWNARLAKHIRMFDDNSLIGVFDCLVFGNLKLTKAWVPFTLTLEIRSMRISLMTTVDYFRWIPTEDHLWKNWIWLPWFFQFYQEPWFFMYIVFLIKELFSDKLLLLIKKRRTWAPVRAAGRRPHLRCTWAPLGAAGSFTGT